MDSFVMPHSSNVRPSAAYILRQSKEVADTLDEFGLGKLIAYSTAAAINSSVTNVVQLTRGEKTESVGEPEVPAGKALKDVMKSPEKVQPAFTQSKLP